MADKKKETNIHIKVTQEFKDKLQEIANKRGLGVSSLLRLWASEHIEEFEREEARVRREERGHVS